MASTLLELVVCYYDSFISVIDLIAMIFLSSNTYLFIDLQ